MHGLAWACMVKRGGAFRSPTAQPHQARLVSSAPPSPPKRPLLLVVSFSVHQVRNKLHDKIRSRKKDLEASLEATRHLQVGKGT